ncbi:hypothetical protein [Halomonas sp. SL1]|uniref:hypothetical protein n=1 Tax=Halomonas sp. SL1 TaxID=2137478 RepID=UPI0011B94A8F|nr:hypothetical protein [Halomonas sp. SL1]
MLLLEVSLNERSSRDVDHLLKPDCPTRVTYQKEISQGHLCWAETDSLDQGGFSFLIAIPELSDDQAKSLIKNNNNELCRLAYKQYHEGNPHDIGVNPENNQVMSAYSWVNSSMLGHLLP